MSSTLSLSLLCVAAACARTGALASDLDERTDGRTGQDASVIYDGNPTKNEHENEAKKMKEEEEEAGRTNANVNMHTISLRLKP